MTNSCRSMSPVEGRFLMTRLTDGEGGRVRSLALWYDLKETPFLQRIWFDRIYLYHQMGTSVMAMGAISDSDEALRSVPGRFHCELAQFSADVAVTMACLGHAPALFPRVPSLRDGEAIPRLFAWCDLPVNLRRFLPFFAAARAFLEHASGLFLRAPPSKRLLIYAAGRQFSSHITEGEGDAR